MSQFAKVPHWVLLADITPRAVVLYGLLREHVNRDPENPLYGQAWPSQGTLADLLHIKRRQTVADLVAELERIGAVQARQVRAKNGARKYYYRVADEPPTGYEGQLTMFAQAHVVHEDDEPTCAEPNVATSGEPHMAMSGQAHVPMCAEPHINQTELTPQTEPDGENQTEPSGGPPAAERDDDEIPSPPGLSSPSSVVEGKEGKDEKVLGSLPSLPVHRTPADKRQDALRAAEKGKDAEECGRRAHDVLRHDRGNSGLLHADQNRPAFLAGLYRKALEGRAREHVTLSGLKLHPPVSWLGHGRDADVIPLQSKANTDTALEAAQ